MKLFYSKTSPYSRKVRLLVHEKGLNQAVTCIACNPFDNASDLQAENPLGKVPTLMLDDGTPLYDSPVICEYLDTLTADRLLPESGMARWTVLRWQALCDGILDAAYNIVMERRRPAQEQSTDWITQWEAQIHRSLDAVQDSLDTLPGRVSLAQLSLGASLGYLDFRLSDPGWRDQHPELTAWYEDFSSRDAMQNTQPE
ncbi:MAG TPA: glutathione S-transferase [Gammaproteobacteria bacterium]|nr:glutathione S-transferase [Gammaproteobacteria bacterium]